jgi:hypothetical protein
VLITGSSPLLRGYPTVESTSPEDDDGWMSDEENATANTLRLDYEQELTFEECLKDIKKLWLESKDQMSQSVRAALHKYFAESANPYVFLSYVVCSFGKGGQKGTHCLPRAILIEFQKWKTSLRGRAKDACELTTGQQQKVLRCVGDHFPHYTDDLFRVFALSTAPLKDRLRTVEDALTAHMFKEAAFYALKLNVRDHFSTRDILLPLIVLDKVNIIQNYLDGSEPLQREFILFLDDTCKHGNERIALLNSSLSEEGVFGKESTSKLSVKQLEKLAQRLIKRYNLPLNDFPHISVMNSRKAFHYILFQRYKMKQISDTNMDELLRAAVEGRSQQEQVLVVTELLRYKDIPAATRLARYCQIPRKFLPQEIRLRLEEEVQFDPSVESHSTSDPGDVFYQLKLPQEKVHWVDGEVSLEECRRHVTMEGQIVAIDGEWRMAACNLGNERLALLQLATEDAIFLLDTLLLEKVVSESKLRRFLADLLTSDKVMKLGYGIDGDFRMLAKSWNFAVDIIGSPKKILDLQLFVPAVQKIVDKFSDISRAKSTPSGDHFDEEHEDHLLVAARGLSLLVLRCFGKPLDKSQQLSDWERRPLRPEQMLYAALDAYCLLEVYHYLREEARAVDPNFDPAPTGPSTQKSVSAVFEEEKEAALRQAQAQANGKPLVTNPPKKAGPQIRPKDLRIIADTMFQGLGRHLRICGVDAKMLSNNSSTYELVKTSIAENRVILTSGKAFFWARNNVPDHLCYHVHSKKPSDQVREVLEYYDVKLTENDILSRCQVSVFGSCAVLCLNILPVPVSFLLGSLCFSIHFFFLCSLLPDPFIYTHYIISL